jgi:hypothetical protein
LVSPSSGLTICPCPTPPLLLLLLLLLQDDDIPGVVRYRTYEVLKAETANPRLRWAYLPYSMHMAGPREAIQHMIIRKNYGEKQPPSATLPHITPQILHLTSRSDRRDLQPAA